MISIQEKAKKEFGSFYHSVSLEKSNKKWCDSNSLMFTGSGRDALYAILFLLEKTPAYQINRVWIPSYYCHSVTEVLEQYFNVSIYEARAGFESVIPDQLSENDTVIVLEYFGHKASMSFSGEPKIILDKTHNPISDFKYNFNIDFVFGSLRKTLPIADGGFFFSSNSCYALSDSLAVTEKHELAFNLITKAMRLKVDYLEAGVSVKKEFLGVHACGELQIGNSLVSSGMATNADIVSYADIGYYLLKRMSNNKYLASLIYCINLSLKVIDEYLYFTILLSSEKDRDFLKSKLIENNIFPAVLWPVDNKYMFAEDVGLSTRTLVLPTDFRYDKSDMEYIANALKKIMG